MCPTSQSPVEGVRVGVGETRQGQALEVRSATGAAGSYFH